MEKKKERDKNFAQLPGGMCGVLHHILTSYAGANFCPFCGNPPNVNIDEELN